MSWQASGVLDASERHTMCLFINHTALARLLLCHRRRTPTDRQVAHSDQGQRCAGKSVWKGDCVHVRAGVVARVDEGRHAEIGRQGKERAIRQSGGGAEGGRRREQGPPPWQMTSLCQDNARCIIAMRWLSTEEKHLCRSARTPTKSFHLHRQVRNRRHRIRFPIPIRIRLGQHMPLLDPKSHHLGKKLA